MKNTSGVVIIYLDRISFKIVLTMKLVGAASLLLFSVSTAGFSLSTQGRFAFRRKTNVPVLNDLMSLRMSESVTESKGETFE